MTAVHIFTWTAIYLVGLAWLLVLHIELPDENAPAVTLRQRQASRAVYRVLVWYGAPVWLLVWLGVQLKVLGRELPWRR